eukprot:m.122470 g.122470  ORF g.122470 m.122470 type:complete len:498 (+) comp11107_c0_seq2:88-1581(+)
MARDASSPPPTETTSPDPGRTARCVGYFVAVCAGMVIGMVSAHSNARRHALDCTAHCEASLRTLRNFLGIVSSPISGALSDVYGRRITLMVSAATMVASYVVWAHASTIPVFVFYNAMNGIAGPSMTFTVCKALVADGSSNSDKVETQGILGASAGLGVILGPVIAMLALGTATQAAWAAATVQVVVFLTLWATPLATPTATNGVVESISSPQRSTPPEPASTPPTPLVPSSGTLQDPRHTPAEKAPSVPMASANHSGATPLPSNDHDDEDGQHPLTRTIVDGLQDAVHRAWSTLRCASPSALILVSARFTISLGYHVFLTGYYDMLRDRGLLTSPQRWSQYMAFLGVLYALTQRLAARPLARWPQRPALVGSILCIAVGRFGAIMTAFAEPTLYATFGLAVAGVAVFNTLINGMATQIAQQDAMGGLLGLIQSAEDVSGLVGPWLGSIAFALSPVGPLYVCLALYAVCLAAVATQWSVVEQAAGAKMAQRQRPKMD